MINNTEKKTKQKWFHVYTSVYKWKQTVEMVKFLKISNIVIGKFTFFVIFNKKYKHIFSLRIWKRFDGKVKEKDAGKKKN